MASPGCPGSYWLEVYGCQMNVSDSEVIGGILARAGYIEAESPSSADVVLVLTCAVREHAEVRALGRIAQLAGMRSGKGSRPLIVLCGCVAQEHGESILGTLHGVDLVVGPDGYRSLPGLLAGEGGACSVTLGSEDYEGIRAVRRGFPRAFVSIMRGCDNYCSYCIVPFVRGAERSREADAVVEEVAELSSAGYGEITLLGQNVNSYSSVGGVDFTQLLRMAAEAAGPAWIRFLTSHPRDFSPGIPETMAKCPNICAQVHLPVQSGSDRMLSLMNRSYTREDFLGKVAALRERVPDVVLSTDMIAGFPGETEEDFSLSLSLLEEVRFDYAFLFRYSERTGTAAASLPGALPVAERLLRLHELQETQNGITREKSRALEGRALPVLVTGRGGRPDQQSARTAGNRVAILSGTSFEPGAFLLVRVVSADGWTHMCEPVRAARPGEALPASESAVPT